MKTDGSGYAILHSFGGADADGGRPWAPLLLDGEGFLYGTSYEGGAFDDGTVFRLVAKPGDADGDGAVDVRDVFHLVSALFASGPAAFAGGDVNGDGLTDVRDVFHLINNLFARGPPPRN